MMELLSDPQVWIAFLTLTSLELVLGIDNLVFIAILADKLPEHQRDKARRIGLFLAMFMRIALLFAISWLIGLTAPLFNLGDVALSARDLIFIVGGLFLLWKSTTEIHHLLAGDSEQIVQAVPATMAAVIAQILLVDLVFSLDSIITAVGMVEHIEVMIAAVIVAVALMMVFAGQVSAFVASYPSIKMLALAFLVLIGVLLVAEGFHHHIPKAYVYFAMAFALVVEVLNIRAGKRRAKST